jgi:hypothetical protein
VPRRQGIFDGFRFAGQRRFLDAQVARLDEAQVGRNLVSRSEQHQVTGHQVLGLDLLSPAVPHHRGAERKHVADRVERLFRLAFLNEADQRIDQHHAQDHAAIHPVPEGRGDAGGAEQHIDQDIVELKQETSQRAALLRGVNRFGPCSASRRATSSSLRPLSLLCCADSASAAGIWCHDCGDMVAPQDQATRVTKTIGAL